MEQQQIIWLASYPRSGNTLLRTILWNCFRLVSASIYPNDLGGNKAIEKQTGHIEHNSDGKISFGNADVCMLKTHEKPLNGSKAIYIMRDGRPVSVSLWRFYQGQIPLASVIAGHHRFGTWSHHLDVWHPWSRPKTLLLKYEDMIANLDHVLLRLSNFLEREVITRQIPDRNVLSTNDGKWIRKKSDWQDSLKGEELDLFNQINERMMHRVGYY